MAGHMRKIFGHMGNPFGHMRGSGWPHGGAWFDRGGIRFWYVMDSVLVRERFCFGFALESGGRFWYNYCPISIEAKARSFQKNEASGCG